MKMTPSSVAGLATENYSSSVPLDRYASQDGRSVRSRPLMRRYEIAHLNSSHEIEDVTRLAPAMKAFEDCFAVLGRGSIVQTAFGPTAVEDLLPGDQILTASSGYQTLLWKGSMTLVPNHDGARAEGCSMTRIPADSFGLGRPAPDLVLGPAARILHKAAGVRTLTGSDAAFVPAADFVDQSQFISLTPASPVNVYQIGFDRHERVSVNGIEVESLHPGALHTLNLTTEYQQLLMSLFPHKIAFGDFGSMVHPRLRLKDLDIFETI